MHQFSVTFGSRWKKKGSGKREKERGTLLTFARGKEVQRWRQSVRSCQGSPRFWHLLSIRSLNFFTNDPFSAKGKHSSVWVISPAADAFHKKKIFRFTTRKESISIKMCWSTLRGKVLIFTVISQINRLDHDGGKIILVFNIIPPVIDRAVLSIWGWGCLIRHQGFC